MPILDGIKHMNKKEGNTINLGNVENTNISIGNNNNQSINGKSIESDKIPAPKHWYEKWGAIIGIAAAIIGTISAIVFMLKNLGML